MRRPRLKVQDGIYHCLSRITGGRFWITDEGKGTWCDQLRRVSVFCGVEVLTYTVLDNHFHLLVRVPPAPSLSDDDLVERYRALYPHRPRLVGDVQETLAAGGAQAESLRVRLLARMHDVSMFLKELKQRFTRWFNARHKLFGTIWDGRFKSILVENDTSILRTVAAYIDLNPLRAKIVKKPEEYRWCGLAAADRGDPHARSGLVTLMHAVESTDALSRYRRFVYEAGLRQVKSTPHGTIDIEEVERVVKEPSLLARQKWLSEGWIVGSRSFVQAQLEGYVAQQQASAGAPRFRFETVAGECVALAGRGMHRGLASISGNQSVPCGA
jgi:hypothetical protein